MNIEVLTTATPPIPSHAIVAMIALIVGAVQLLGKKGTETHRWMGRFWVGLMAYIAISSFFISEIKTFGYFSPIHILSVITLLTLVRGVRTAYKKQIAVHKRSMIMLYFLALIITGLFTFLPGRVMHQVLFGI